jgi:alpha-glucosidase
MLAIVAIGFAPASPATADPPPVQPPQTAAAVAPSITVTAVAPGVFHLLVNASPLAGAPPASPFIVPPADSVPPPPIANNNAPGTLTGAGAGSASPLTLKSSSGAGLLTLQSVSASGTSVTIVFRHDPGDRYYGSGNAGMSDSGPLIHTSAHQFISNGVTRVPFIWSPTGYGILVANDIHGLEKYVDGTDHDLKLHIDWTDSNGLLTWTVPASFADIYLMAAPGMYGVLGQYARLTGSAPIPPRWTFGYLQSRWGYMDAADIQDKWHQFRDRKIPIDAFIYDYDWFSNDWEFNPKTFPDPEVNLARMHAMNLHFVGIRKPRVHGKNYDFAKAQGWMLNKADLRFDLPAARAWWWSHQSPLLAAGVDGWWNDESESAYDEFFFMSKQEYDGGRAANSWRQWSINRAFSPGIQHYGAAVWTGDILSKWEVLAQQPGTMLNWSLAGMPYTSQDTGGFNGEPGPELYARWMEVSAFIPIMRAHGDLHNTPRFPWMFGDKALAAATKAIHLRYRMIPYLYTEAEAVHRTGVPLMRPLFMEFPDDRNTWGMKDEWLLGDRVLAAPVMAAGGVRKVYLPAGGWFDGNTGKAMTGGQTIDLTPVPLDVIPFFVRAGTILPLGPVIESTAEAEDPLEVRVYPGADADFTLYEDAGDNYDYEKGASTRIPMHWDDKHHILTIGKRAGSFKGMPASRHLQLVLPGAPTKKATYTGGKLTVEI